MAFGLAYGQGTGRSSAEGVAAGGSGNVYVTGDFAGTVDFDPGPGVQARVAPGDDDAFLVRYDADGNLAWVRVQHGLSGFVNARQVKADADGDALVGFAFGGTAQLDDGAGTQLLTTSGGADFAILRYDALGDLVATMRPSHSTHSESLRELAVDGDGDVVAVVAFEGTVTFDSGVTVASSTDVDSAFVVSFDPAGEASWALAPVRTSAGESDRFVAEGVAADASGGIRAVGDYRGAYSLGGIALPDSSGTDGYGYVAKLDEDGSVLWATTTVGPGPRDVAVDAAGNAYVTGAFFNSIDFDPGPGEIALTATAGGQYFLAKYDSTGAFLWVRTTASQSGDTAGADVVVDAGGNVLVTGNVRVGADFSTGGPPAPVTPNDPSQGQHFVARYDSDGNLVWLTSVDDGPPARTFIRVIDAEAGRVYVAGEFDGTLDFDPGTAVNIAGTSRFKHFIAAYGTGSGNLVKEDVPPETPIITTFATDSGDVGDFVTSDTSLAIAGTAEPFAEIHVFRDGAAIGDTIASADGSWSFADPAVQAVGLHRWRVTAEDAAGNVSPSSPTLEVLVVGTGTPTSGSDVLTGSASANQIRGGAGNDSIAGDGGNDTLKGNDGNDLLLGGSGSDRLEGENGNDIARGGTGNDSLYGQNGNDSLLGENGNDRIEGGAGADTADGGAGNDTVLGGIGIDVLADGAGTDRIHGDAENDLVLLAEDGARDSIYGTLAHFDGDTVDGFVGGSPTSPGADVLVLQGLSLANAKKLDGDAVDGSLSLADVGGGTIFLPGVVGTVDTALGGDGVLLFIY